MAIWLGFGISYNLLHNLFISTYISRQVCVLAKGPSTLQLKLQRISKNNCCCSCGKWVIIVRRDNNCSFCSNSCGVWEPQVYKHVKLLTYFTWWCHQIHQCCHCLYRHRAIIPDNIEITHGNVAPLEIVILINMREKLHISGRDRWVRRFNRCSARTFCKL